MWRTLLALALLSPLWGGAAGAASLPIAGTFGNAAGCDALMHRDNADEEEMILLRADGLSFYEIACKVASVGAPAGDGTLRVETDCQDAEGPFAVSYLLRPEGDGYVLSSSDGQFSARLATCR